MRSPQCDWPVNFKYSPDLRHGWIPWHATRANTHYILIFIYLPANQQTNGGYKNCSTQLRTRRWSLVLSPTHTAHTRASVRVAWACAWVCTVYTCAVCARIAMCSPSSTIMINHFYHVHVAISHSQLTRLSRKRTRLSIQNNEQRTCQCVFV